MDGRSRRRRINFWLPSGGVEGPTVMDPVAIARGRALAQRSCGDCHRLVSMAKSPSSRNSTRRLRDADLASSRAAIARASGVTGAPLDTKHPAIRETLRGIGRTHGSAARRSAALRTTEVRKLVRACGGDPAGQRDRALLLLGFAGAFRRSELVGLDLDHVSWTDDGMKLRIVRSKTDKAGEGAEIALSRRR